MKRIPCVIKAEYRGEYRIHVTFDDRSEATIDFRRWLKGPVFEPLKDRKVFRRFFLDGWTVAWPNGADIAPEALYEYAQGENERGAASPARRADRLERCGHSRTPVGRRLTRRASGSCNRRIGGASYTSPSLPSPRAAGGSSGRRRLPRTSG